MEIAKEKKRGKKYIFNDWVERFLIIILGRYKSVYFELYQTPEMPFCQRFVTNNTCLRCVKPKTLFFPTVHKHIIQDRKFTFTE